MSDQIPKLFLARVQELYPRDFAQISQTFHLKRPVTFRLNSLKTTRDEVLSAMNQLGIEMTPVPWYEDAFLTDLRETRLLSSSELFNTGKIYIQNLSSMIPPLVMDPLPTHRVLDLAAAPGSKTTQMASLMGNTGEIVANDKSHERLYKLKSILKQQGVSNVSITQKPGEILWKWYPEQFDRVLVDVPCSMEGRITTLDPDSYKDWSPKKIKVLTGIQKKLLRSAVSSARVGGEIVYSTCTLSPEENEEVIDWILKKEEGAVEVVPVQINGLQMTPGLVEWQNTHYSPEVAKTARILPSETMEGFFVAKLRKVESTVPSLF